jgi:hypothetical protein
MKTIKAHNDALTGQVSLPNQIYIMQPENKEAKVVEAKLVWQNIQRLQEKIEELEKRIKELERNKL